MANEKAQALEALGSHPGWRLYVEHLLAEWGPSGEQYRAELDKALNLTDNEAAASQARQIRAVSKMVERFIQWPAEEVARLQRSEGKAEVMQSRGGYR